MPKPVSLAEALGATAPRRKGARKPPPGSKAELVLEADHPFWSLWLAGENRLTIDTQNHIAIHKDTVNAIHGLIQAALLVVKDEKYKDHPKVNVLDLYATGCDQAMKSETFRKPGFYCGDEHGNYNMYEEMMVERAAEAEEIKVLEKKLREAKAAKVARIKGMGHSDSEESEVFYREGDERPYLLGNGNSSNEDEL